MDRREMLGPWLRRFLLEHVVHERNLSQSYRDTLTTLLPYVADQSEVPIDRLRVVDLSAIRRYVKVKSDANPFDPLWGATSSLERDSGEPTTVAESLGDVFYRLRSRGAYTRLEPDDGKLSRPVLRGGSNAVPLPDPRIPTVRSRVVQCAVKNILELL